MRIHGGGARVLLIASVGVVAVACSSGNPSSEDLSMSMSTSSKGSSTVHLNYDQCGTGVSPIWPDDGGPWTCPASSSTSTRTSTGATSSAVPDSSIPDAAGDVWAGDATDASDATTDAHGDPTSCPAGQSLVYTAPGCGSAAHPVCAGSEDACIVDVCNCDGTSGVRCDYSAKPYAHDGPCGSPESGADAGPEGD
jgi:hypothetical protein